MNINDLVEYLQLFMEECAGEVDKYISFPGGSIVIDPDLVYRNNMLNYSKTVTSIDYDDTLLDALYFVRYGYAYAYEYETIHEIIQKDYPDRVYGVTSLGCGSLIDAWSLAYANKATGNDADLYYYGNDCTKWGISIYPHGAVNGVNNPVGDFYPSRDHPRYPGSDSSSQPTDIIDFFEKKDSIYCKYNTMLFAKILNELDEAVIDQMINCIEEKAKANRFIRDTYYIAISHAKSRYLEPDPDDHTEDGYALTFRRQLQARRILMQQIAKRIVDAINVNNDFNVKDDLPGSWLVNGKPLVEIKPHGGLRGYRFPKNDLDYYDRIAALNKDFDICPSVNDTRKELKGELGDDFRYMSTTSNIVFQIIKLTRKQ